MEQITNASAPESATDEPGSFLTPTGDIADFDPVPLRYRTDGLTPERQRAFVEALADCGLVRAAARRIGVSEQAVARVRRRADARAFDLACEAAQRLGARRLRAIAYERAIEGSIRRHYYHGELKSEERVYDNRLLIYLLGKTAHLAEPPPESEAVIADWEGWMDAVEQGLPAPPPPDPEAVADEEEGDGEDGEEQDGVTGYEVWEEDGCRWTSFPPPEDFDGEAKGRFGSRGYCRTLSPREQEAYEAWRKEEVEELRAAESERRDAYFGFAGGDGTDPEEEDDDDDEDWEDSGEDGAIDREERILLEMQALFDADERSGARDGADAPDAEILSPREAATTETSEPVTARSGGSAGPRMRRL